MKNLKNIHYWCFVIALVILFNSCKKEFLEKTPTDSIVDANFYKTNDQVLASTALLYSRVWFDYNDKASFNIGDFRAGTVSSAYNTNYRRNVLFNTTREESENGASWRAFFNVIAQANMSIINIHKYQL